MIVFWYPHSQVRILPPQPPKPLDSGFQDGIIDRLERNTVERIADGVANGGGAL
jgi:hypothetical protein